MVAVHSGTSEKWTHWGRAFYSEVVPSLEVEMYGGKGLNSVSIAVRLSTLQSVHYQRFHCRLKRLSITLHRGTVGWLILMVSSLWLGITRATPTGYHCTTSCRARVRFLMLRLPPARREGGGE